MTLISSARIRPKGKLLPKPGADPTSPRPQVRGKFLWVDDRKFYVRGVTYGTFKPDEQKHEYPPRERVARDFAQMAAAGLNTVRTYTSPPRWLLDLAHQHGLRVLVGLAAERYVGYLLDPKDAPDIAQLICDQVAACAGHPAILCYAIGNEIPAPLVRYIGRRRIERYLRRLYRAVKATDPGGLVTYVNYPTAEYLDLPFLDLVCFNVYLESPDRLEAYIHRLHNIAGNRPLILAELGLDSIRNGEEKQAQVLAWQVRSTFACGCAGAFVYAWTDEWFRGGEDVFDWRFGITDRERQPKPALDAVCHAYAEAPFPEGRQWPKVSVVVCTYNGSRTLEDCLEGLRGLEYPDFEVIVVDDGSTDAVGEIARRFKVQYIRTENQGLSAARNTGMRAATGQFIAYIDDDAWPDPHWLHYLVHTFETTDYAAVGGPNIAPPGHGLIADCVAASPGGPTHVLLADTEAEHIPGCNMAFRAEVLRGIGGFDVQYRVAGDDVDVCWRVQAGGGRLGFCPAAVVWHHRRNSIRTYWKQQRGYGKAEALLEMKWPEKYNCAGHLTWSGRVYGNPIASLFGRTQRVYHGMWGSAPFQSVYEPAASLWRALPLMPEWYLIVALLGVVSALGIAWQPLLWLLPVAAMAAGASIVQAAVGAIAGAYPTPAPSRGQRLKRIALTFVLHLSQPLARLLGRIQHGLAPWRRRGVHRPILPVPQSFASLRSGGWMAADTRLHAIERSLRKAGAVVRRGGDYDEWDLEVHGGLLGSTRVLLAVEDLGYRHQLTRVRAWPRFSGIAVGVMAGFLALSIMAIAQAPVAAGILGVGALALGARIVWESAHAMAAVRGAVQEQEGQQA